MKIPETQIRKTMQRYQARVKERNRNLAIIHEHRYFQVDSANRVSKFLLRRGISSDDTEKIIKRGSGIQGRLQYLSLERVLGTSDLVNISFLEKGMAVSRTIGRVWICENTGNILGYGTGFMVSPRLMLTNHHVLPEIETARSAKIEFNYQLNVDKNLLASEIFSLDPDTFYFSNQDLDFALVAVFPETRDGKLLSAYGYNKLIIEEGKTIISQWLNIIQHPNGMPKQIGLRENQLIDIMGDFLLYRTDTSPGSSGSPVYNELWEVVGLHHSGVWDMDKSGNIMATDGGIWNQAMGEDSIKWIANEGIRVSSILKCLKSKNFGTSSGEILDELLNVKESKLIMDTHDLGSKDQIARTSVDKSGSLTWTFPITITVQLGDDAVNPPPGPIVPSPTKVSSPASANTQRDEAAILDMAKQEFLKRGDVLNVRMGYVFRNGWITKERAIVVTVPARKSIFELGKANVSPLPTKFMEYPIEVTGPTISELIVYRLGQDKQERLIYPDEVSLKEITYVGPDNAILQKVTDRMKVNIHVSPEQGWKNLKTFLSGNYKNLTVAMYDFGAKHILSVIKTAGERSGFKNLTIAIQPGESVGTGTKADDLRDDEVVRELESILASKFNLAWIRIGRTNGWVSSSYHIKVAVKDSNSFWLSSGNWQSSNQPNIDDLPDQGQDFLLKNYNREWHAIIEHKGLAETYENFIKNDYEHNKDYSPPEESFNLENLDFLIPSSTSPRAKESYENVRNFPPFEADREFTVTPLLTPDNFYNEVLALVNRAEKELLIQNQTFNAPKPSHQKLEKLINAVLMKQQAGVDVKIIFRVLMASEARKNLEALKEMGFDTDTIRVQKNCHTKGVIVDGKEIMLGSQNWSNDGVSVNRDASLLFEDAELADYFRTIFYHDWENLAMQDIGSEADSPEIAVESASIPANMELVRWSDIREAL
jgi:hypothetical protein